MYEKHGLTKDIKKRVYAALYERQQGKCFICGVAQSALEEKAREYAKKWAMWQKQYHQPDITQEELDVLMEEKYERSAVHRMLHIDHCHVTGMIRGLLCVLCNSRLAVVENCGLLDYYLAPAYQYNIQEASMHYRYVYHDEWIEQHRGTIFLYMQQERWIPRKDILFHLQAEE